VLPTLIPAQVGFGESIEDDFNMTYFEKLPYTNFEPGTQPFGGQKDCDDNIVLVFNLCMNSSIRTFYFFL